MKDLPKLIGKELFLKIDYLICRFMKNKRAYKINQNDKNVLFTVKKIQEKGLHPQFQFHIRFKGQDRWNNEEDTIDFDFYISEEEMEKLK